MRGVRDAVSQHVFPPPPSPMLPAFGQPQVMPHMVPARPCPAEYMGPGDFWWARPLPPEADRRRRPEPGRAGAPADRPERPEGPSPRSRADASVQAEPADIGGGPDLRRTFEGKPDDDHLLIPDDDSNNLIHGALAVACLRGKVVLLVPRTR